MTQYLYIFVRQDLPPPQRAVQAVHAALEAKHLLNLTWEEHPHLALCGVKDLRQLNACAAHLQHCHIPFVLFHEPARNNEATAIATGLVSGETRRLLKRYQLLKLGEPNDDSGHRTQRDGIQVRIPPL